METPVTVYTSLQTESQQETSETVNVAETPYNTTRLPSTVYDDITPINLYDPTPTNPYDTIDDNSNTDQSYANVHDYGPNIAYVTVPTPLDQVEISYQNVPIKGS